MFLFVSSYGQIDCDSHQPSWKLLFSHTYNKTNSLYIKRYVFKYVSISLYGMQMKKTTWVYECSTACSIFVSLIPIGVTKWFFFWVIDSLTEDTVSAWSLLLCNHSLTSYLFIFSMSPLKAVRNGRCSVGTESSIKFCSFWR